MSDQKTYRYCCKRCHYKTDQKLNMRSHLSRKQPCDVIEGGDDIDMLTLYDELGPIRERKQVVTCSFCKNAYADRSSLYRHVKTCKKNPERIIKSSQKLTKTVN